MGDDQFHRILCGENGADVYIGSQEAAKKLELMRQHSIRHVVCLGSLPFHEGQADLRYLVVEVLDLPSENLIAHLDSCVSFIQSGLERGEAVLVHCVYGQSRSAAVLAAFLMTSGIGLGESLAIIHAARSIVHINPGFRAQLQLYADMGCQVGTASWLSAKETFQGIPTMRQAKAGATFRWFVWATKKNAPREFLLNCQDTVCKRCIWDSDDAERRFVLGVGNVKRLLRQYRCKACRTKLFTEANVIDHMHPICLSVSDTTYEACSRLENRSIGTASAGYAHFSTGESAFALRCETRVGHGGKRSSKARSANQKHLTDEGEGDAIYSNCACVFTEVLPQLGIAGKGVELTCGNGTGKIRCWGRDGLCGNKLGSWSLKGITCCCGRLIKPAVQFTRSRIELTPQ
ncbi:unnamed protein product [Choristocarpus tenellus]